MSDIETGGPAFPTSADNGHSANQDGMTLRDYFAAKVIASLILVYQDSPVPGTIPSLAESAYQYADAMLQARQQAGRG